ncbi:MAG: CgeB family protein [Acidobacteriaceae bacterium]
MNIFVFGSSIVSSYWNGAATYYRGIYKALHALGHHITFAEPDAYGRQQKRDAGDYSYVESLVYAPCRDLDAMLRRASQADLVIKHSGIGVDDEELELRVLECQPQASVAFWDVDAPATIARMNENPQDAFPRAIPRYDAVLTYGGGPEIERHYRSYGARVFASIYNGLDSDTHHPVAADPSLTSDLAFIGNRLPDRERRVEDLFLLAAKLAPEKQFLLGGEGWGDKALPPNVRWVGHVPTTDHNRVNCSAAMVLNINRASMATFGFSPPTRVFEVAGSGSCLLCDDWPGVEECFKPGKEILVIRSAQDVVDCLRNHDQTSARILGQALRARALRDHTYMQRARVLDDLLRDNFHLSGTAERQLA